MFSEESLGKLKFGTFPKRVGSRKALITLEQVNTIDWSKKKKRRRILISKTEMVGCCKLLLYANRSCDQHAVYFGR